MTTVKIGDTVINLDRILYARQDVSGLIVIYFESTQLQLGGDDARHFWRYYAEKSVSLPSGEGAAG